MEELIMKKEDLTALGLSEEQIAGVQKLSGLDVDAEKKKTTAAEGERDKYKGQLETAQIALKEFDGVDVKDLKGKIDKLNEDIKAKDTEYAQKLADRDFSDALKVAITEAGGKNAKAVMACLDMEALKTSKNQKEDIGTALKSLQESDAYLFGKEEPFSNPTAPTGDKTPPTDEQSKSALWAAMGIKE